MDHDYGFAPNPFWGVMTLATCKGLMRKSNILGLGDWVIATGTQHMGYINNLIYAMKVEQRITFDDYWNREEFQCKKPIFNGSVMQMYGDNVYHSDENTGRIIQEKCAHTNEDGSVNLTHYNQDTRGKFVLISRHFYYFGNHAPELPNEFRHFICKGRNFCYKNISSDDLIKFISWLESNYEVGIHGDPINWREFPFKSYPMPEL